MSKTTIPTGGITADAIDATLVTDDAISDEHLDVTAVTGQTAITSLADTDKFLVSDASDSGNLKYVEKQYLGGGGSFIYLGGINSSNHSANKLQLTQVFADDYRRYKVMGKFQGTGNGANVEFRWLNSSNGELTSNYHTITDGQKSDSSSASNEEWIDWGATKTRMFIDTATGSHIHSFTMDLFPNQNENVDYPTGIFQTQTWDHNSGGNRQRIIQGALYNEVTTSLSGGGIQFESTSGLFGTVNISIWGYKDS